MTTEITVISGMANEVPASWITMLGAWLSTVSSDRTRTEYRRNVAGAVVMLGQVEDITPLLLTQYRERVVARIGQLAPSTINIHLSALRSFFRFCRIIGLLPWLTDEIIHATLKGARSSVRKPYQVLTKKEIVLLLHAAEACPRDHLLLGLAIATGLRCAELCAIQIQHITMDEDSDLILRVCRGKGNKDRLVPLASSLKPELLAYLSARKIQMGQPRDAERRLFDSRAHGEKPLTTARVRQIIQRYLKAAGITYKRISMHSLRHTAAIAWIRSGASVVHVQKLLGHASLNTTQRYLDHVDMDDLKNVVNGIRK